MFINDVFKFRNFKQKKLGINRKTKKMEFHRKHFSLKRQGENVHAHKHFFCPHCCCKCYEQNRNFYSKRWFENVRKKLLWSIAMTKWFLYRRCRYYCCSARILPSDKDLQKLLCEIHTVDIYLLQVKRLNACFLWCYDSIKNVFVCIFN